LPDTFLEPGTPRERTQEGSWLTAVRDADDLALRRASHELGQALLELSNADVHVDTMAR
jgi:hypothetical protein